MVGCPGKALDGIRRRSGRGIRRIRRGKQDLRDGGRGRFHILLALESQDPAHAPDREPNQQKDNSHAEDHVTCNEAPHGWQICHDWLPRFPDRWLLRVALPVAGLQGIGKAEEQRIHVQIEEGGIV